MRLPPPLVLALWLAALLAALGGVRPAAAQEAPDSLRIPAPPPEALPEVLPPSPGTPSPPLGALPPPPAPPPGDRLQHPVRFSARDSLVISFAPQGDPQGDLGTLYGEARASYDEASLTAHEIDLLFDQETLRARGLPVDTGFVGLPAFQRGTEGFTGRELAYNLATERGRLVGARTQVQDGYLLGGVIKQVGQRTTFAQDVVYTTCEYEDHTHWGLHAHRLKLVDGEWVYTGPAQLHLLGIPTPLWLPFGFFPSAEGRRSGPLPPDYGEQSDLGFFLRNLGYYWAVSEYFDLQVSGDIYTSGSYGVSVRPRYARRDRYTGDLALTYNLSRQGEPQDPAFALARNASVVWSHRQTLDATGNATLNGSVNLRTAGTRRFIATDYNDRVTQQTSSSVTFQRRWRGGRNVNLSYNQNLNLSDGSTSITLPRLQFNQPNWHPFRPQGSRGQRWFEQVSLSYRGSLENSYAFSRLAEGAPGLAPGAEGITWLDGLLSYDDFRAATGRDERFRTSARHLIPVATRFAIRQLPLVGQLQLDITPSLNYSEEWFTRRQAPRLDERGFVVRDTTRSGRPVVFDTEGAFTAVREASLSLAASTQAFGTVPWRIGRLDGFRHTLRPTASFNLSPDYRGGFWGRSLTYVEPDGTVVAFSSRPGAALPGRAQQTAAFSVANVFQTRVVSEDTAGATQRRLLQLLALDATTAYNFTADSLGWAPVSVNARTDAIPQVNVSLRATFSPYAVDALGQNVRRSYFSEAGFPLRFTNASLSASTQLRSGPAGQSPQLQAPRSRRPAAIPDLDGLAPEGLAPYDFRRPDLGYVDFSIPWSLNLDLNYGLQRNFRPDVQDTRFATLNAGFDVGLTQAWRVSGRSGFDFERGEIVATQLSVLRDLHCFEMSATWSPFGLVQAFSFSIYVKSGYLRDILRVNVPNVDRTPYF